MVNPLPLPESSPDHAVILLAQRLPPSLTGQPGIILGFSLNQC